VTLATAEEDMPQPPAHEGQNTYWRLSIDHSVTAVQQQRNSSATAVQQQCDPCNCLLCPDHTLFDVALHHRAPWQGTGHRVDTTLTTSPMQNLCPSLTSTEGV
jgi:hypothetical protein